MSRFMNVRVLVAGDLMLDRFMYGKVGRISPEAPVPVFSFEREKRMLGGAGNVAANLIALGCNVTLAGMVGRDESGDEIRQLARDLGAREVITTVSGWPTVVKTRIIAGNNHLLRVDQERKPVVVAFPKQLRVRIEKSDVVLLSDYAKGYLTAEICRELIGIATDANKKVLVDPKGTDWERYRGAWMVKPNLKELALVSGRQFDTKTETFLDEVENEARRICRKFGIENLVVTLSEHGMMLVNRKNGRKHVPTEAREVFDVSGAGDTALAAFGVAIGSGYNAEDSLKIANAASGIVVSKLGTATVTEQELEACLGANRSPLMDIRRKIVDADTLGTLMTSERAKGRKIGFTNGCFDCCHLGHLHSLAEAKKLCDVLVVGVNSDASVKRHKGPSRPIQDENTRMAVLAANEMVDYVVKFDDDVPMDLVKLIRPDVIAKEGYPLEKWPEGQLVEKMGGKAVELSRLAGYSTSALVKKMTDGVSQ